MPRRPNRSTQTLNVLQSLLESPTRWRHGYDLSQEIGIKSGTLYPILMRLAEQGWLETKWSKPTVSGRPPRHLYRLTSAGKREAQQLTVELAQSRPATRRLAEGTT